MERSFSDHHVLLCKVRLLGLCIKRKGMVNGARKIRESYGVVKGVDERFSVGLFILKEWRMIGLLKGCVWLVA